MLKTVYRLFFWVVLCSLLVVSSQIGFAQEDTIPPIAPIITETPTPIEITPTIENTPTLEPTIEITSEITAEPTQETTLEFTPEVTQEATSDSATAAPPEATQEITPPPDPNIFQDDFQDSDASGWLLTSGWQITSEAGNNFLTSTSADGSAQIEGYKWPHFLLSAQVTVAEGQTLSLIIRDGLSISLNATGSVRISRNGTTLAQGNGNRISPWQQFNVQALGTLITVAVDNVVQVTYTDSNVSIEGPIIFSGIGAFDDLIIHRLDAPIIEPPITEVPITVVPTQDTPTDTVPSSTNNTPEMGLFLRDTFDSGLSEKWSFGANWILNTIEGSQALQIGEVEDNATLISNPLFNTAAQISFWGEKAQISVRSSAVGSYTAELSADGTLNLYRAGILLQTVRLTLVNGWNNLKLSAIDTTLRVSVNDSETIVLNDDALLPPGMITFSGKNTLIDNVEVWIPVENIQQPTMPPITALSTFVVNSTADAPDSDYPYINNISDGVCASTAGGCTIRAAIQQANHLAGLDTIQFSIGTGPVTIPITLGGLPTINSPVIIDGTTQPGYAGNPIVMLDGNALPTSGANMGLTIRADGSTIRGLVISNFGYHGIIVLASSLTIQGNYIGTTLDGMTAAPNESYGISMNGSNNLIGGTTSAQRNVIAGNKLTGIRLAAGDGNTFVGNYIGVNAAGTAAIQNGADGLYLNDATNTIVGGTTSGARNIISGNKGSGLYIAFGSNNTVQGNYLGVDVTGNVDLGNMNAGLLNNNSMENLVGGTAPGAGNVMSGNGWDGVYLSGDADITIQGNFIGTNAAGTSAIPNRNGIAFISSDFSVVGGTASGAGNIISGNYDHGIALGGEGTIIQGNFIGTNPAGAALGNQENGIQLHSGKNAVIGGTVAGAGNTIAFNLGIGINDRTQEVLIQGNSIHSNTGLGIDISPSAVTTKNVPVLTAVHTGVSTVVTGTFNGMANTAFRIEFFANAVCDPSNYGEGQSYLGFTNITTNGSGAATINVTLPATSLPFVTATATDPSNYTSEFSRCRSAPAVTARPILTAPANNAVLNTATPLLTWNVTTNAAQYGIQIAENSGFTTAVQNFTISNTSFTLPTLTNSKKWWRVRGINGVGNGPWSSARNFTVDTVALTVQARLTTPANNAILSSLRPTFVWTNVNGAARYRLQVDDDLAFNTPEINQLVNNNTRYIIPGANPPLAQGIYHWRVLAIDPAGNEGANWSNVSTFSLFIGTNPANNAFSPDTTPAFRWAAVAGTTGYIIQISSTPNFSSFVAGYPLALGKVTSHTPTTALTPGTYYWRVLKNDETAVDIIFRTLFIGTAPRASTITSPSNNSTVTTATPTIQWSNVLPPTGVTVVGYQLHIATNSTFTSGLQIFDIVGTSFTTPTLEERRYYVRVRALFGVNSPGAWSQVVNFRVNVP